MTEQNNDPWTNLALSLENGCRDVNDGLLKQGIPPVAFDLDAARAMIIVLRDAGSPVPTQEVVHGQDRWGLVFRWKRIDGEAWVSITSGPTVHHMVTIADDDRVRADDAPMATHDMTPFLAELDHFTSLKQVLVIRRDLKMRQGKAVSQGSHSSGEFMREQIVDALKGRPLDFSADEIEWMTSGMAKITVRTDTQEQFDAIAEEACARGLKVRVITDAGHTEFHGVPTVTTLAIGPTRSAYVDPITKELTLL